MLLFVIRVNLLHLNHPCSFLVYYISLVFSYLSNVLFSCFLQFKGNFVDGRNNSKYRDIAPSMNFVSLRIEFQ